MDGSNPYLLGFSPLSMDIKTKRFALMILACSASGVILGGTASWADSSQCFQAKVPTSECVTQDPLMKTIEGMSFGLLAGAGAAIGATFQIKRQED